MATNELVPGADRFPSSADREYRMLIDGEWVPAASGETFRCVDPFDAEPWGRVPLAGEADVDRAVAAARRAFDESGWPQTAPGHRAALLRRLAQLIEEHADELALTQIHENGKLISEMSPGAHAMAIQCVLVAGLVEPHGGYTVKPNQPNLVTYTVREPVGVVGAITPWNSPLGLLAWKLLPALAVGCTVVIKPSEVTPTSTLRLGELIVEVGFPKGVVNIVTGDGSVGAALAAHPHVDKIAFTGSTATGRKVAHAAADRIARVSLELGGKSPNIVFADADLDNAAHGVMSGIFAASGQTCMAGSRVLVEASVYDEFAELLVAKAAALRLGDPLDWQSEVGPIASRAQFEKVLEHIEVGTSEGARLLSGTRLSDPPELARGFFVPPTIFGDVDNRSRLAQEEIFGPVACLMPFTTEAEAVRIANDTAYGLAAAAWTRDLGRAHRMVAQIRAGSVWINTYRTLSLTMPFGGFGQSGIGRENGIHALDEYTEVKSVYIDLGNQVPFGRQAQ